MPELMINIMNLKLILVSIASFHFLLLQFKNMLNRIKQSQKVYKDDISYQQEQAVKSALENKFMNEGGEHDFYYYN